ncbi:MAG: hypothetical protein Q9173_006316 [Seirophora scorigena]
MDPSADSLMPASIAFATLDPRADNLTPASIAFPTLAIIAIVLGIPPLVWHATNRNLAACNLISWTILVNLCSFVNALIWPTDNVTIWFAGYVLCDIEAKILLAASVGIAGSLACIMRALAKVLDTENTRMTPTRKQRYQELVITALLCFGIPIYMILIHYVVQPSRYYIMAIAGCTTSLDNSWPALVLVVIWSPVLCLVAVYYATTPLECTVSGGLSCAQEPVPQARTVSLLLRVFGPATSAKKKGPWLLSCQRSVERDFLGDDHPQAFESEKMSRAQDPALMTSPTNTSHSTTLAREDRPLPPVPAQSKPSWLKKYFSRPRNPSASGDIDIESAMERYDNHRPNRFIAGLWHANNAGNSAPVPATQMGNCNGLRV